MADAGIDTLKRWYERPDLFVRELFGVVPDAWQDDALRAFPTSPRLAMRACRGPGKALSCRTLVPTPAGIRRWGDIRPGDFLFAQDGEPTRVVGRYDQGVIPLYRVVFDDGSAVECSGAHLWKVRGRTERRHHRMRRSGDWTPERERKAVAQGYPITPPDGYVVLTTEEIIARNDCGDGKTRQFSIPRHGAAEYPSAAQPIDPYLAGVWIGDGSRGSPRYTKPYLEVEEEINRRGYETRRGVGDMVTIVGEMAMFRRLECFDKPSYDRFVPIEYREASVDQRRDLICGLMDTDGCIGKDGHMEFSTTSERLAHDVVWLVRSLGGVALVKASIKEGWYRGEDGERVVCRDCWRVTVVLPFNPFRIAHKAERWGDPARSPQTERYLTRYLDRIEPAGEGEAMCVEVDHPSHCYLANDFVVTHNTAVLAWIGWNYLLTRPHPMCGATSITGPNLKANLWTELARWYNKAPLLQTQFEMTSTEIYHRQHRMTWKMEARTWPQDADSTILGNALGGVHAKYALWLGDESGDYPDGIMPIMESIFAGDPVEAHIVQAGNPLKRSGPLYRACTTASDLWHVVNITGDPDDPKRSPRISIEYAREQIRQYGRDNPFVLVSIFGQFPPSSLNALLGPEEMAAAQRRSYGDRDIAHAAKILGVDVAREGNDASVMFPRQGLVLFPPSVWRNIDGIQGAGAVARKWDEWEADACFVDNTGGFGASWIDCLRLLGRSPIGVVYSSEPQDRRFFNKRAEMYWNAAQWIKEGGQIPECPELVEVMTNITYTHKNDRLLMEDKGQLKARIGSGIDFADAFVETFAEPVMKRGTSRLRGTLHRSEYDPYGYEPAVAERRQSWSPNGGGHRA